MPDIDVIVVGYGSAGKRHEFAARSRHLSVVTVDPDHKGKALMFDYEHALRAFEPQMVVVATPPDTHLEIIEAALRVTPYVLCEKPLCDLGQLEQAQEIIDLNPAQQVNVAFNYRYHHALRDFKESGFEFEQYSLYGSQFRAVKPRWGYLLDHVSHDIDIMRMLAGDGLEVDWTNHIINRDEEVWNVGGHSGVSQFLITDAVKHRPHDRIAGVSCSNGRGEPGLFIELDADKMMYDMMWDRFIAAADSETDVEITMDDAMITQRLLEDAYRMTKK